MQLNAMVRKIAGVRHGGKLALALLALAGLHAPASAGGYLVDDGAGNPALWNPSGVTVNLDLGTLGSLSNASADALVLAALDEWSNASIPTCALTFAQGADLASDQTGSNRVIFNTNSDGITPVAYDHDGTLINAQLGAGQNQVVVGFAGPIVSGGTISEGRACLNGLFIDGAGSPTDVSQAQFEGVIVHEFGHMLNLDHAQCNNAFILNINTHAADYRGFPTMYPIVHSNMNTPAFDDQAWISHLYPDGTNSAARSTIAGVARDSGGTLLNGVNIVARNTENPVEEVITCVTGFNDPTPTASPTGAYRLPSLPEDSTWVIDFEQIRSTFIGGSSVGTVDPPITVGSPAEYINESAVESNSDALTRSTTFVAPAGGDTLSGIDLRLNSMPTTQTVAENDAGATFPTDAQALTITPGTPLEVNGSIDAAEADSGIVFNVEDWYVIQPAAGLEVTSIVCTPDAGVDVSLITALVNQPLASIYSVGFSDDGGDGVVESLSEVNYDTTFHGAGTAAGKLYVGVSGEGTALGDYTLAIEASVADSSALMVGGANPATIDVSTGNVTITGRGFSTLGGGPTVAFSDADITVNSVTVTSSTQLSVSISMQPGYTVGTSDVTVTNAAAGGGYAGIRQALSTVPTELSVFATE